MWQIEIGWKLAFVLGFFVFAWLLHVVGQVGNMQRALENEKVKNMLKSAQEEKLLNLTIENAKREQQMAKAAIGSVN